MEDPVNRRSALHCPICKKPYTDSTTSRAKSRHVSYCRKKHQTGALPRRKACDECVRSKVRCSAGLGVCSRCASRGLACTYPQSLGAQTIISQVSNASSRNPDQSASAQAGGVSLSGTSRPALPVGASFENDTAEAEDVSGNNITDLAVFCWENEMARPDWSDLSDLTAYLGGGSPFGLGTGVPSQSDHLQPNSNYTTTLGQLPPSPLSIAPSLNYKDPAQLLERRKFEHPDLELTSDLALHILRSYPYMMTNNDSLPPFIHPRYQELPESGTKRPSALNAAINLAKMVLQGRNTNKSLVWGLIRNEQERLLNEHHSFDRWEVLEALQSLILYLILRMIEGRHDYTDFGSQLLTSVNAMCGHISTNFGKLISADELMGKMIQWKDWVFFESRRRAATAMLIINRIVHAQITPIPLTMPEYPYSPAPSPKGLWNAGNETDWSVDYAEYLHRNAMHGMLKNGDLVRLKEAAGEQHDRWYAHADSFGLLVTLASSVTS